jgi:hypothetical protein
MPITGGDLFFHIEMQEEKYQLLSATAFLLGNNGRLLALLFTEIEIPRIGWLAGKMSSRTGNGY